MWKPETVEQFERWEFIKQGQDIIEGTGVSKFEKELNEILEMEIYYSAFQGT